MRTAAMAAPGCATISASATSGRKSSSGALPRCFRDLSLSGTSRSPQATRPFFGSPLPPCVMRRKALPSPSSRWPLKTVMEWQDCSAEIVADVPCSVAYDCYSDREAIPEWMPFISSVKILKDKPDLSRWTLKYVVFGQDVEFSWLARNLQPIRNQKIHWRSLEGLPNRGAVRFYPKGPTSCRIQLTVSYEIPDVLIPVSSALKPFLEGLLFRGLERFVAVAKSYKSGVS